MERVIGYFMKIISYCINVWVFQMYRTRQAWARFSYFGSVTLFQTFDAVFFVNGLR